MQRLFDYIGGANENDDHIPMTAPVMTAVTPGQGPFCVSHYNVSFFMPEKVSLAAEVILRILSASASLCLPCLLPCPVTWCA